MWPSAGAGPSVTIRLECSHSPHPRRYARLTLRVGHLEAEHVDEPAHGLLRLGADELDVGELRQQDFGHSLLLKCESAFEFYW